MLLNATLTVVKSKAVNLFSRKITSCSFKSNSGIHKFRLNSFDLKKKKRRNKNAVKSRHLMHKVF